MRKLLPLLLALAGLGGGIGAGLALKPAAEEPPIAELAPDVGHGTDGSAGKAEDDAAAGDHGAPAPSAASEAARHGDAGEAEPEFVKLNNQFVVPVVTGGRVVALVVLSVSLQVGAGNREAVFVREPKLRDVFLQVLFDHANAGGFDGVFTSAENLRTLRMALLEAAQSVLGDVVSDILIMDMMRQES